MFHAVRILILIGLPRGLQLGEAFLKLKLRERLHQGWKFLSCKRMNIMLKAIHEAGNVVSREGFYVNQPEIPPFKGIIRVGEPFQLIIKRVTIRVRKPGGTPMTTP
jgi:hypothetical protein